jgi:hypothetical protein
MALSTSDRARGNLLLWIGSTSHPPTATFPLPSKITEEEEGKNTKRQHQELR